MQQTTIPLPVTYENNIRPTASTTQFWIDRETAKLAQWLVEVGGMEKADVAEAGRLSYLLYGNNCWLEIHPQSQTGAYQIVCKGAKAEELADWVRWYARGERGPLEVRAEDAPPVRRRTRKKVEG